MRPVRFLLFGRVRVEVGGQVSRVPPTAATVLTRLLLASCQLVTVTELARIIRPGRDGPVGRDDRMAVQKRIADLRLLLDPDFPGEASPVLRTDRGPTTAYRLVVERTQVDIFHFEDLLAQAGSTEPARAAALVRQALRLWNDRPLLGIEHQARETVQRLNDLHAQARHDLARLSISNAPAQGRPRERPAPDSAADEPASREDALHTQSANGMTPTDSWDGEHSCDACGDSTPPVPFGQGSGGTMLTPRSLPPAVFAFTPRPRPVRRLDGLLLAVRHSPTAVVAVVSGTAGVGKTALAVHWAHRVADRFPDGQLYVNLRGFERRVPVVDPGEAVRGLLEALGIAADRIPGGLAAQTALYRSLLFGRRILVVLDNARDGEQVRPLLPSAPGCLAVVTSRDQLTGLVINGAQSITLDPLDPAEARQMLATRLDAGRLVAEPRAVDEIISRCGRLPLALAVAAARAAARPAFPLRVLADELREAGGALHVLATADPSADVRTALSGSYDCVSADAAWLFRLLSLHLGPDIATPAVVSLAGITVWQTRRLLAELSAAHLLTEPSPGRYALHNLLRAFATEQTQVEDSDEQRRSAVHRILDHYLQTGNMAAAHLEHVAAHPAPVPLEGVVPEQITDRDHASAWLGTEQRVLRGAVNLAASAGYEIHARQIDSALATFEQWTHHRPPGPSQPARGDDSW